MEWFVMKTGVKFRKNNMYGYELVFVLLKGKIGD